MITQNLLGLFVLFNSIYFAVAQLMFAFLYLC